MLFSDEGKPKGFVTTRTTLKDCLKPVLQTEKKKIFLETTSQFLHFSDEKKPKFKGLNCPGDSSHQW